jgi:hypothetical protein
MYIGIIVLERSVLSATVGLLKICFLQHNKIAVKDFVK